MIKINLVREGRAVRGAGAPAAVPGVAAGGAGGGNLNNVLIIALTIIGVLLSVGYWFMTRHKLADTQATMEQRQAEAKRLDAAIKAVAEFQTKKDNLQKRIDLINQLKQNQKGPVRIMDQVSRDLPDLVWLKDMNIANGRISLNGFGLNPNAIALFVANIKGDAFFEEPQFGTLQQVSITPPVYSFDLSFAFTYAPKPPAPGSSGTPAMTGTAPTTATTGTTGTVTTTTATAAPGKRK